MASQLGTCAGAPSRSVRLPVSDLMQSLFLFPQEQPSRVGTNKPRNRGRSLRAKVSDGGDSQSYLNMWKKAVESERKNFEFEKIVKSTATAAAAADDDRDDEESEEELEKKTQEFQKILEVSSEERDRVQRMQVIDRAAAAIVLEVSSEERDRVQRMQVIDRAAAAIAAARAILKERNNATERQLVGELERGSRELMGKRGEGLQSVSENLPRSDTSKDGIPGPDFWSWTPPPDSGLPPNDVSGLQTATRSSVYPNSLNPIMEKERSLNFLSIPFESKLSQSDLSPTLLPSQSLIEVEKLQASKSNLEAPSLEEEQQLGALFSDHAVEAAHALQDASNFLASGVNPDGSRWWRETGIEQRPDGVICRWTMTRGVSADEAIEWQEKFWEAADEFGYKELGSEKSGRDAIGNVWREFWRESMRQENGLMHIEKTADKWGKNGKGDEWQEKWWEQYNAAGQAEKWAHKWCSIDPNTPLEVGHAHVWHERWGEKYDGKGGSIKYTDKWAERSQGDGWEKWGDKWDENFDLNGHGIKQGETWWEGKNGERWNRTWGEQHNGSGWIHKYGKSSSGEHWDTHVQQDTWYERYPHYGFYNCYENSVQLRQVQKPSEMQES